MGWKNLFGIYQRSGFDRY
jgi:Uncharacterized protein conserved in bacteria